jgi:hypothetical protein
VPCAGGFHTSNNDNQARSPAPRCLREHPVGLANLVRRWK